MRSIKRIVSMVLTVVMLLGMIPTQTVSALSLKDLMGTQNTVEPAMARNDDFSLQLEWKDNNSNTALDINESQDVRNAATLRVNYTCMNVRPEGYKAGDLVITVKGIGDVQPCKPSLVPTRSTAAIKPTTGVIPGTGPTTPIR